MTPSRVGGRSSTRTAAPAIDDEHSIEIEHQLAGRNRERSFLAPRLELRLERCRAVSRFALERLGLDRDHQRRLDAIDQRSRMAREQRQQVLPPGEGGALFQSGQALTRFETELIPDQLRQALAEEPRLVVAAREQIERQHGGALELAGAALAHRVEGADRVDGVAEEVEPQRLVVTGRKDVEDAAANRQLADAGDQIGAVVAMAHQVLDHLLDRMVLADREGEHARRERSARRQPALQRARRRHDGGARRREDAVERRHLLGAHRERDLGLLVRGERRGGEPHHLVAALRQGRRRRRPLARLGLVRHHDDQRPVEIRGQRLEHPGGGARREAG